MVYHNEFDPHAASWLRGLMADGLIHQGVVDERSIADVQADDVRRFTQCHFFSGIGGWCEALRLAGWPTDRPVWCGSCPCQPYSAAGRGKGDDDERNRWPDFFRLIRECRPHTVIGEQVEGAIRHGWLDGVQRDLEGEGYAVGHCVLGAHSVGAPHIRQRLYWVATLGAVADAEGSGGRPDHRPVRGRKAAGVRDTERQDGGRSCEQAGRVGDSGPTRRVADAEDTGRRTRWDGDSGGRHAGESGGLGTTDGMGDTGVRGCREGDAVPRRPATGVGIPVSLDRMGHADIAGREGRGVSGRGRADQRDSGETGAETSFGTCRGFWDDYDVIPCSDGKSRRVKSGLFPLAHGVPFRLADGRTREGVSRAKVLRGIGNAIVPAVAAEFIMAFMEAVDA